MDDRRSMMSDKQFANVRYGASREIDTKKKGKKSGYYVSRDPRVPIEVGGGLEMSGRMKDPSKVKEHYEAIKHIASKVVPTGWMKGRAATAQESADVHQGIWHDKETEKTYLDISDRIGKKAGVSTLREALERGIAHKQLAIWSAGIGRSLPVHEETETKTRKVNPAAQMQIGYLKGQEAESARRRSMSKTQKEQEKSEAISAWEKAFPKTRIQ